MKDRTKNSIKPFWSWNDKLEKDELQRQIERAAFSNCGKLEKIAHHGIMVAVMDGA